MLFNTGAIVPKQDISDGIKQFIYLAEPDGRSARQLIRFEPPEHTSTQRLWAIHGTHQGGHLYLYYHRITIDQKFDVFETFQLDGMGIDISAGPTRGVIAWVVASAMGVGINPVLVVVLAVLAGVTLGTVNGSIVVFGRVAPTIATLGTAAIFQSVLFVLWASRDRFSNPVLPIFSGSTLGGFPILIIPVLVVFGGLAYVLKMRRFGLHIYAVGNDPEGARLLGVSSDKVFLLAYALMGGLTGLGALFYIGRVGVVQANSGADMSIAAIATPGK